MLTVSVRGGPDIVRGKHGTFTFYPTDMIGRLFATYGEWAEQEFALMRTLLKPGDFVLDVGAHIGTLTVPLARAVGSTGRVIAFEAQRKVFHNLCANIHLNALPNVIAHNCLVGDAPGGAVIVETSWHEVRNSGGTSFLSDIGASKRFDATQRYRIDDLLIGLPKLRLVKMDVEGSEPAALRGMADTIQRHRPILYIEANTRERHASIREILAGFGYRLFWHARPHWNPDNFLRHSKNLFGDKTDVNVICFAEGEPIPDGLDEALDFTPMEKLAAG